MIERITTELVRRVADQRHRLFANHGYLLNRGIDNIMRLWRVNQIPEVSREFTRSVEAPSLPVERG